MTTFDFATVLLKTRNKGLNFFTYTLIINVKEQNYHFLRTVLMLSIVLNDSSCNSDQFISRFAVSVCFLSLTEFSR